MPGFRQCTCMRMPLDKNNIIGHHIVDLLNLLLLYAIDGVFITLLVLIRRPCDDIEELPQGKQALWAYKWLNVPGGQGWHSSMISALVLLL